MALNIKSDDWVNCNEVQNLSNLQIGSIVKIANNYERFWVKIIDYKDTYLLGKIDNYLTFNFLYDYQDIVIFEKNNILDIHKKEVTNLLDKHFKTKCKYIK